MKNISILQPSIQESTHDQHNLDVQKGVSSTMVMYHTKARYRSLTVYPTDKDTKYIKDQVTGTEGYKAR